MAARRAAAGFLLLWLLCALLAPWLSPRPYAETDLAHRLERPTRTHPLGTDDLGRDVLSRVLTGSRVSLAVTACALAAALALGTAVGIVSGYAGGALDMAAGRVMDVLLALPGILLAIAIVAYVGRGFEPLILALSATAWVGYARLARSVTLSVKSRDFVLASLAAGARTPAILRRHVLPQTLRVLSAQATAGAAGVMLSEAGLSFLGLGIQPPYPSWGEMLASGCDVLLEAPHLALVPGALLFLAVWALNTLGDEAAGGPAERMTGARSL